MKNRPFLRSLVCLFPGVSILWVAGLFFRDQFFLSRVFYCIPALLACMAACLWLFLRRRRLSAGMILFWVCLGLVSLGKMLLIDFAWNSAIDPAGPRIRLVHWNCAHAPFGLERVISTLSRFDADVVLLSEPPGENDFHYLAETLLPQADTLYAERMGLISRFPKISENGIPMRGGRAWQVRLNLEDRELRLIAVDVRANPLANRAIPLADLGRWIDSATCESPTMIIGDFNTPRDSVCFRSLRKTFSHAYEKRGSGWPYTWPFPIPFVALDHAWYDRSVDLLNYRLETSWWSDHRLQVVDFRVEQL